jgi:hypothetical protein
MKYQFLEKRDNEEFKEWVTAFGVTVLPLFVFFIIACGFSELLGIIMILMILAFVCYFLKTKPEKSIDSQVELELDNDFLVVYENNDKTYLKYTDINSFGFMYPNKEHMNSVLSPRALFIKDGSKTYLFEDIPNSLMDEFAVKLAELSHKELSKVDKNFMDITHKSDFSVV